MGAAWSTGCRVQIVTTSSMAPAVPRHSLTVVRPVAPDSIRVGDVISFRPVGGGDRTVLHRVTAIAAVDDTVVLHTKGDANDDEDPGAITGGSVTGRMVWHADHLGAVGALLLPPVGPAVLIGIPLTYLVVSEVLRSRRMRTTPQQRTSVTVAGP
jgi:signal peptidase